MDATKPSVTVLALGSAAALLGWSERSVTIAPDATLRDLVRDLEGSVPALAGVRSRLRYAVNQRYAGMTDGLSPGDEVAIIPPVSGG
jgi:molybdopterin converting factor small subunit